MNQLAGLEKLAVFVCVDHEEHAFVALNGAEGGCVELFSPFCSSRARWRAEIELQGNDHATAGQCPLVTVAVAIAPAPAGGDA